LTLGIAHCCTLIRVVSVEYFPGHFFLTAQNHGTEYSLSRSLPRPSHFIVRDNDQLRLLLSSVDSSSLPSALVQTMLLINSFTITQRKLCKLLAFTCAVSLAVSLRRVLLRGIFLIRVVSVEYFPGHFFLTAQNHGTEYSLSRSLPRPSHFIVRDNDQLRLLLSSVDSSSLPSALVQTMLLINSFTITQRKLCKLLAFTCAVSLAVSLRRVLLRGIFEEIRWRERERNLRKEFSKSFCTVVL